MEGITNRIVMIEPGAFGFNEETAKNNLFQKRGTVDTTQIREAAHHEFTQMTEKLRLSGLEVKVIKDTKQPETPDAIFPNNWVSFHENKQAVIYPLYAPNRRLERRKDIFEATDTHEYAITDLTPWEKKGMYLEGTGSMVLDRKNKIAYAALSERTNKELFRLFCYMFGYKPICFTATHRVNGKLHPVYHTNVMMCLAHDYAVICLNVIRNKEEHKKVVDTLQTCGKTIIEITEKQMNAFAGNMLQLKNNSGQLFLVMSTTARHSLTRNQSALLESRNMLVDIGIPTIEHYGGGSVRCMMTELF